MYTNVNKCASVQQQQGTAKIRVREHLSWAPVTANQVPTCHGSQEKRVKILTLALTKVFSSVKWEQSLLF